MTTLGVYVQVPFCASKCTFCNFDSGVVPTAMIDRYCAALEREIVQLRQHFQGRGLDPDLLDLPVDTVYIGGGTPTLLGRGRLSRIFRALGSTFHLEALHEWTLEATPGSADSSLLAWLAECGVNRLSIGAQSFDDRELRWTGRLHTAADTCMLVEASRRAGFRSVSLDLIAGLPGQTEPSWIQSLQQAIQLKPQHLSVYLFEIDEKSRLGHEALHGGSRYHAEALPDEGFVADAYEEARRTLVGLGFEQYEISNFARAGYESVHNLKYWRREPYVGLGAGAHSFDGRYRWSNEAAPEVYRAALERGESPIRDLRELTSMEAIEEFFFLGLRHRTGVDVATARARWGAGLIAHWDDAIRSLRAEGWLEGEGDVIRLAPRAYLLSNEVFQRFLLASEAGKSR